MSGIVIPEHLRTEQLKASDPRVSVWVSANAGSGKTHVLTQRVIRLLLDGVPPARILCLTFTKAAAAQMATRVFKTLADWTSLDDAALRTAVAETGAALPDADGLRRARRLFTRTVETPGGLKIQTIHAFCERLLHLFPFEANVPARFEVADDARQAALLAAAKRDVVALAHRSGESLAAALTLVADEAGAGVEDLIGEAMRLRARARFEGDAQPTLARHLGAGTETTEQIETAMLEGGIAPAAWPVFVTALNEGSKQDQAASAKFAAALGAYRAAGNRAALAGALSRYLSVFFTATGSPAKSLMTKGLGQRRPDLLQAMLDEQARLLAMAERRKAAETVERTQALLTLADLALRTYEAHKAQTGILDFDDLIERTRNLLAHSGAGWVLHKLDKGIDHVLVDEAQDTSEAQWRILDDLTGDFASGLTAGSGSRSFFAVGDDKQSIFSFQGAAPHKFDEMRKAFTRRFEGGGKTFKPVRLKTSFRSVPGILEAVDKVFEPAAHQVGLVASHDVWPGHDSVKVRLPGLVEVWPPVGHQDDADPTDWRIPVDMAAEKDPASTLAARIARTIAGLVAPSSPERVHDGRGERPRPIRPGDVLILVRRRSAFFEAVIRALKQAGVPVAGADRLDVANHIAVMDLVAAGRAALLPHDDLTLACLLKSPLFGFTDDDLIALAPRRKGALIEALRLSDTAHHRAAHDKVMAWGARAAEATPFAFFVEILGRDGGRRQMEARLGPEAHDAIDEFLRLALAHERDGVPALSSFLDDIEALNTSVKRDMEGPGDAVRVMTVHAAKGLEAKVVFLPDTCGVPSLRHEPTIFDLAGGAAHAVLAWSPRKDGDCAAVAEAREAARGETMKEYRRLLYVALTRAEERLYIAGFHGAKGPDALAWSAMIRDALAEDPATERVAAPWDAGETILRRVSPGTLDGDALDGPPPSPAAVARADVPAWLTRKAAPEADADAPIRPSQAQPMRLRAAAAEADAARRGSAVHSLLQHLPDVPPERRQAAALGFLAAKANLPTAIHAEIAAQALAVLAMPELAPLFAPGSRAEVPIAGTVDWAGGHRAVRGTVDRLAVRDDCVLVVDYKSGRVHGDDAVPEAYLAQMALYRLVLARLWPGRRLRMMLLWTASAHLVELSEAALARAEARAASAA